MTHTEKRFELIEHTADTGIVAYGRNMPEAFANAAYGLFSIITEPDTLDEAVAQEVAVTADDIEALLLEWLNELIFLFDARGLIFKRFEVKEFEDKALKATCYGEKYNPAKHELKLGVKAATYHMLEVDKKNNRVQVIFDI